MTDRYRTPDSVIGIGGGGKAVVERFMQKDYILDEVLRPREATSAERRELRAFTIDTDTEAQGDDKATENRINNRIKEIANKYDRPVNPDTVGYEYLNVIEQTDRMRIQPENLVRKPNVPEIAENAGLSCWWLRKSDHMIGVSDDYTNGVDRRRGLSKALFHASQMGLNPIKSVIDQASTGDHCAMVVGIGGGTGSGMFIDIAKDLQREGAQNLTLFAILPQLGEGDDVKANATAVLSELERLALDNKNPFKNVVLIPYEPAASAAEFGDAVVQIMLSYYNVDNAPDELDTGEEGLTNFMARFDASGQGKAETYAPFTVAIPQKLYYAADEVAESRDTISNYIQNKREAIELEAELYDAIEEFVAEYCSDEVGAKLVGDSSLNSVNLTPQQTTTLREQRVSPLKQLLSLESFEQLGYESAGRILERIETIEKEIEAQHDDIDDTEELWGLKHDRIPGIDAAAVMPQEEHTTAEQDETFAQLILDELELIGRRRDLMKTTTLIEDPVVKQSIESALDNEITGVAGTRAEEALQEIDLIDQRQQLNDIVTIEDAAEDLHGELLDEWRNRVQASLESFISINNSRDDIEEQIDNLQAQLRSDIQTINNATRAGELPRRVSNYQQYSDIDQFLHKHGYDPIGVDDIVSDMENILAAAESWHEEESGGWVSGLIDMVTGGGQDDRDRYIEIQGLVNDDFFHLPEWDAATFNCSFRDEKIGEARSALEAAEEESLTEILQTTRTMMDEIAGSTERLETFIKENDQYKIKGSVSDLLAEVSVSTPDYDGSLQRVKSTLQETDGINSTVEKLTSEDGAISELLFEALVKPIEEFRETKEAELTEKQTEEQKYERLHNIIRQQSAKLVHKLDTVETPDEIGRDQLQGNNAYAYTKKVLTEERGKLLGREDIADAQLWESPDEPIKIHNAILEFLDRTLTDSRYSALKEGTIKGGSTSGYSYSHHRIFPVLMSRAFEDTESVDTSLLDADGNINQMKDEISDNIYFPENQDRYMESIVPFGAEWDISLTMFIGGVFLDNLAPLDTYKEKYDAERDSRGDDILVRHTHGIDGQDTMGEDEDGAYVFRESLVNLNTDEVSVFTGEDIDTAKKIKREYQRVVGFDSRMDLELD